MKRISLNGIWTMTGGGYKCDGNIPGSVYSFLLNNKLIPDPYYRTNELEAVKLLENDFTFSRKFNLKKSNSKTLLSCEGLDTLCSIYINDYVVANTNNMHISYEFDVSDILKDGENEIRIIFRSPNKYIREMHESDPIECDNSPLAGFTHIRKTSCMMGWDWGPRLPDAGIWKDISLLVIDNNRIKDVHITQRHENGKVFLTPNVETFKDSGNVRITLTAPDKSNYYLQPNFENEIENPMLWWPNGFGKQNLYTVKTELLENGVTVDCDTKQIGLRTIQLVREDDEFGQSFCHEVNGVRIFAMGANYIPEDNIFSRLTKERTEKLLKSCKDCNFNTIRVWGGGFYPHDYFFDICDKLGLLVFEDMMFACMKVPEREEMIKSISTEIRQNLKRIRHHACLAVISGNNEMEHDMQWDGSTKHNRLKAIYLRVFENIIPNIIKEECSYIPYIPSSPTSFGSFLKVDDENYGDSHYWKVYHGNLPFTDYRNHYFRYLSEFGFQSFPSEKTINAFTLPEDRNIFSRTMELHQRSNGGNRKILSYLSDTFLYPTNFGTLIYASQLLQAEAMRYGVEHLRRNRGRCMGTLYWQLNDIWPVASWSGIDYFGRFKALQYAARRFYAPVMISCKETGEKATRPQVNLQEDRYDYTTQAQLNVTNETLNDISGTVIAELRRSDGKVIDRTVTNVTVPALSSIWLDNTDYNKTDVVNNYLSYRFVVNQEIVSEGTCLFTAPKHFNFKNPNLRYEINGDEITVYADAYAKYVEIDSPDCDFVLSDNYFDIDFGSKTVKILEGTPKNIRLRSVYDIR